MSEQKEKKLTQSDLDWLEAKKAQVKGRPEPKVGRISRYSTIGMNNKIAIPGTPDIISNAVMLIVTGKTPYGELCDPKFQKRHAEDLYKYLIDNMPSGIFKEFVLLILKDDLKCNNYYSKMLRIPLSKTKALARKAGVL